MRKSWADYKRAARKREKDRWAAQERELNTTVFQRPFSDFSAEKKLPGFGVHYLILGNSWWDFTQDGGIEPLDDQELNDDELSAAFNSLGKAELVLSVLEDVMENLAANIADYKRSEIEARIAEIKKPDLAGLDAEITFRSLERLKKMRHNLGKTIRQTRPQTRAAG